jgi:hypothetical protein
MKYIGNKPLENSTKGAIKVDNPEKPEQHRAHKTKTRKTNTQHHYTQTNTNNVNKT